MPPRCFLINNAPILRLHFQSSTMPFHFDATLIKNLRKDLCPLAPHIIPLTTIKHGRVSKDLYIKMKIYEVRDHFPFAKISTCQNKSNKSMNTYPQLVFFISKKGKTIARCKYNIITIISIWKGVVSIKKPIWE